MFHHIFYFLAGKKVHLEAYSVRFYGLHCIYIGALSKTCPLCWQCPSIHTVLPTLGTNALYLLVV